jgi:predicted ferric reductase
MGLHRWLSWLALLGLTVHIAAALLDRSHVPAYAVVAPFLSPVRTIATGTGSLATWGLVVVVLTAARRRWFKHSWRRIHYLAYPVVGAAATHSLLGSDRILLLFAVALCLIAVTLGAIWPRQPIRGADRPIDAVRERAGARHQPTVEILEPLH